MNKSQQLFLDTKFLVHLLVCVFAISSWVDINGMWVELPILVTNLPEKWTLPSYITIISQIANVGPLIFFLLTYCWTKTGVPKKVLDRMTSYVIMIVGMTSALLLAFFWKHTLEMAGSERSFALLALSFSLAIMDCTSSVAFVAFMASLKPAYMASFFLGEGLSGLIPALLALAQGAGDIQCVNGSSVNETYANNSAVNVTTYFQYPTYLPPRFSVQVFFFILTGMIFLCIVAFTLLNYWGYCQDQFVAVSSYDVSHGDVRKKKPKPAPVETLSYVRRPDYLSVSDSTTSITNAIEKSSISSESRNSIVGSASLNSMSIDGEDAQLLSTSEVEVTLVKKVVLLVEVVIINFLITSFLLSVQVYSSLPYGISNYNLVVTLSNIANPVACAIAIFVSVSSLPIITLFTSLGVGCGAYIIVAAVMSPSPVMVDQPAGGPVMVVIWVGASFFLTYAKVSVAGVMRHVGRHALIWYGAATQGGALIGALTGFFLVNEAKVFKDASWC